MILMVISFWLDNLIGMLISNNSLFFPLFTLLSLVLLYPSFKRDNKYYLIALLFGLLYDFAYTNTPFLNSVMFLLAVMIIKFYFDKFGFDLLQVIILSLLLIISYRVLVYLVLILIGYLNLEYLLLFESIYGSIFINIVFIIVSYKITLIKNKR